jgi:hypothetical protein
MKRRTKKILAGVTGIGLIVLLLSFVNSFVGNPVSNALAKKAAQQYIDTHYNSLNLNIQKSNYNFKFSSYHVLAQSSTSVDTAFNIYVDSYGNVIHDDYESEVANHFTTFRRLDDELRTLANEILGGKLGYDFDHISLPFVKEATFETLERDMRLDIHNPPLPLMVNVVLFSHDVSYSKIAEAAKAIEAVLQEQNIPVREYNIRILPLADKPQNKNQAVSWVNSLSISSYPADRMDEKNLPQAMEQFETGRVSEMNKKDKK